MHKVCKKIIAGNYNMLIDLYGSDVKHSSLFLCAKNITIKKIEFLLDNNVKNLANYKHTANYRKWTKILDEIRNN